MKEKKILGVSIIHKINEDVYYQSLKQYIFYSKSSSCELSVSFCTVSKDVAEDIIRDVGLVESRRDDNTIVYHCQTRLKHDLIQKKNIEHEKA